MGLKTLIFSFLLAVVVLVNITEGKGLPVDNITRMMPHLFFNTMNSSLNYITNIAPITESDKKELLYIIDQNVKPQIKKNMIDAVNSIRSGFWVETRRQDILLFSMADLHEYISDSNDVDLCTNYIDFTMEIMKKENLSSSLRKEVESLQIKNNGHFFIFSEMLNIKPIIDKMIMNNLKNKEVTFNNNTEIKPEKNISSGPINRSLTKIGLNWWLCVGIIFFIIYVYATYLICRKCLPYHAFNKKNIIVQV